VKSATVGGVYSSSVAKFLAVNDSALFWANSEVIHRINLSDGSDTTLLDHSSNSTTLEVYGIALDASNLYFAERGFQSGTRGLGVAKISLDGSSGATTIADAPYIASPVVVADGYLYFQVSNPTGPYVTTLQRVAVGGGTPTALISNVAGGLGAMAVAGGYLWFSLANAVYRIPVTAQAASGDAGVDAGVDAGASTDDAGNPLLPGAEIFDPNGGASELTTDANRLYGASGENLWALPLTGGQRTTLAQSPTLHDFMFGDTYTNVRALALHGGWIYWNYDASQYADISKTPITGGQTVAVVPKSPATAIATNSSSMYFVTPEGRVFGGPL
jgi:hypothetical protein